MNIVVKNGEFLTEKLYKDVQKNVIEVERCAREAPHDTVKYPVGYVLPLGTLGNAPSQTTQFKSNFHIVAYLIADDLLDKEIDFEDFNLADRVQDQGQISKLSQQLDGLAESTFGPGWRITVFNVRLAKVIESMCKGNNDLDSMKKAMEDLFTIVNTRIGTLRKSTKR